MFVLATKKKKHIDESLTLAARVSPYLLAVELLFAKIISVLMH